MTAVLKLVVVPSGDSSKDVRERGDLMLLRLAQPLAKASCLERASSEQLLHSVSLTSSHSKLLFS